jgi:hypothetical protein
MQRRAAPKVSGRAKWVLLVVSPLAVLAVSLHVVPLLAKRLGGFRTGLAMRELRSAFFVYAASHSPTNLFPVNLEALYRQCKENPGYRTVERWTNFLYVANLPTNVPGSCPIVMSDPENANWEEGAVLFVNGRMFFYLRAENRDEVRAMVEDPVMFVTNEIRNNKTLEDLRNRIRIIYP